MRGLRIEENIWNGICGERERIDKRNLVEFLDNFEKSVSMVFRIIN